MVKLLLAALLQICVASVALAEDWRPITNSAGGAMIDVDSVYVSKIDGTAMAKFRAPGDQFSLLLIFDCHGRMMVPGVALQWVPVDGVPAFEQDELLLCVGRSLAHR